MTMFWFCLDVTDWASLPGAVQAVLDAFGTIDLLVNNAGVSQRSLCKDTDMSVYQKLMDVDVMGQIALTKAILPHMLERGSGHLAVTSSVAGKVGAPMRTGYCAAKHAVMGFLMPFVRKWKARVFRFPPLRPVLFARIFPAMPFRVMVLPLVRKMPTLPVAWT